MPAEKAEAFASLIKAAFRLAGEEPAVWDSALGLTQRETARLLGCTQARISDMEAGVKPISAEAAQLFAKRFGVSPALFLK